MHIGAQIEVHMAVYIAVDIKVHVEVHVEVHSAYNSAKLIHQHVRKGWNTFLKFARAFFRYILWFLWNAKDSS